MFSFIMGVQPYFCALRNSLLMNDFSSFYVSIPKKKVVEKPTVLVGVPGLSRRPVIVEIYTTSSYTLHKSLSIL